MGKAHTYRLAEEASDEFDEDYRIATLDFEPFLHGDAADKARFAGEFAGALQRDRLRHPDGHGVDPALYDETHDDVLELFTRRRWRRRCASAPQRYGSVNQGYFPIEETSDIHPDLVEGWVFCRRAFDIPQIATAPFRAEDFWPRAEYEPHFRRLVHAHEPLIKPIAQAMFQASAAIRTSTTRS